jgi:hypothetical protein
MSAEAMTWMVLAVRLMGLLHFAQLPSMRAAARGFDWAGELARLSPLNRRMVQVIGLAIVLVMCGLGGVVLVAADHLVRGGRLALALDAFLAVFLGFRAFVQWRVYAPLWPTSRGGRLTHVALGLLFTLQSLVYALAGLHGALL